MHVLIIEDELPAYKKLLNHVKAYWGEALGHSHVRSVKEGIKVLSNVHPFDLILSDIRLLDGTAFEIFDAVSVSVPIIFCTAYDTHLLEAFKTNGIAYILKPYAQKDIEDSIKKYQTLFHAASMEQKLLGEFKSLLKQQEKSHKKRFAIKKKQGIHLLETQEISYVEAYGDLCRLMDVEGGLHVVSKNIGNLMSELDPAQFFRINRSQVVNIEHIEKIEPYSKNRLSLRMKGSPTVIFTSTRTTREFRKWLEQ